MAFITGFSVGISQVRKQLVCILQDGGIGPGLLGLSAKFSRIIFKRLTDRLQGEWTAEFSGSNSPRLHGVAAGRRMEGSVDHSFVGFGRLKLIAFAHAQQEFDHDQSDGDENRPCRIQGTAKLQPDEQVGIYSHPDRLTQ